MKTDEIDRIVARIDETRIAEHFRNPDRPDTRFVKSRRRQDPAVRRAKGRLRTAVYRNRLDQRGAPSSYDVAMALLIALATVPSLSSMSVEDQGLVELALTDLHERGFDLSEVDKVLRRIRVRMRS